jgi:amino acid transporter
VLCGVLSIFGAQTYVELGCMIPKAGGDYEYIMAAFGNLLGFIFVWGQLVIIIPTTNAVAAKTFANYLLQPFFDCDTRESLKYAKILIASLAVCEYFKNSLFWIYLLNVILSSSDINIY